MRVKQPLYNIQYLFKLGFKFRIPLYQRNYDWGEREVVQLLEDVSDYAIKSDNKDYYIGSLVVYERSDINGNNYLETVDGQQRLTTIFLILCAIKNALHNAESIPWFTTINISYEFRKKADITLNRLFKGDVIHDDDSLESMNDVYNLVKKHIPSICRNKGFKEDLKEFFEYLVHHVKILLVTVPRGTRLNHYFEIMNSREEQLEEHEILKALLMNGLDKKYHKTFNDIWESCSNMESHVINNLNAKKQISEITVKKNISELILEAESSCITEDIAPKADNEQEIRFGSVVNFPNFLLLVLKITYHDWDDHNEEIDKNITLDDKKLLDSFQKVLKDIDHNYKEDKGPMKDSFIIKFAEELLLLRYLFDKYIIKRESTSRGSYWSLKDSEGNSTFGDGFEGVSKQIRMLESMFHVSAPTQNYKYWLLGALTYLRANESLIAPVGFRNYLFHLAQSFMIKRYLIGNPSNYYDIIYKSVSSGIYNIPSEDEISEFVNRGTNVPNFIFNYFDFIEWEKSPSKYKDFIFTYRTSVEHLYPQHPIDGVLLDNVDTFGNLCLITRNMNSKFSNHMPKAKYSDFAHNGEFNLSIKLTMMFNKMKDGNEWNSKSIESFTRDSIHDLRESLKQDYQLHDSYEQINN